MYFLGGLGGWRTQSILWEFIERNGVELHTSNDAEVERIRSLMEKYSDTPPQADTPAIRGLLTPG
jgi:hypothetical protein